MRSWSPPFWELLLGEISYGNANVRCLIDRAQVARQDADLTHHCSMHGRHPVECVLLLCLRSLELISRCGLLVDSGFSRLTEVLMEITIFLLTKILAIIIFSPIFVIPSVIVAAAGGILGNIYMKAQLSVKRELSVAKAPVLGHFGAAVSGISWSMHHCPIDMIS